MMLCPHLLLRNPRLPACTSTACSRALLPLRFRYSSVLMPNAVSAIALMRMFLPLAFQEESQ